MEIAIHTNLITPQKPCRMAGYAMRKEPFKGIHDDLEASILWMYTKENTLLFISMDVINLDDTFGEAIRDQICAVCAMEKHHIIISGLHTHAGPLMFERPHTDEVCDWEYRESVIKKVVDDALACRDKRIQVNPKLTHMEIEGIYGNRNGKDKYGDKNLYLLEFYEETVLKAAFCNLSCHATVLGPDNGYISADLTGNLRRALEQALHVPMILTNGNAGDISNRQYRKGNDFVELERVVHELCSQILQKRCPKDISMEQLKVTQFHYPISYRMDHEALQKKISEYEERLKTEQNYDQIKLLKSGIAAMQRKMGYDDVHLTISCVILDFTDVKIITMPGEMVSILGKRIKDACDKTCIIWGYANGSIGYIVEQEEYGKAHESISSLIPKGEPEKFVQALLKAM